MRVPNFIFPHFIKKIGSTLPKIPPSFCLVFTLNQLVKRDILPADMSLLAGKRFEIEVLDAGIKVQFSATEREFVLESFAEPADLRLAANTCDFMKMMLSEEDPDTLFFNRKLQIEGETELGLIAKNLLDSVDWDQTPLSYVINH